MSRAEFMEKAKAAAIQASKASGLPAGVAVAQAILESNFGESQLSKAANNYFGIKAHGTHPAMSFRTHEFLEQKGETHVSARFAVYSSMEECFACRDRQFVNGKAYVKAIAAKDDPETFVREMAKHWATDPQYAEKVLKIYRENGLAAMDSK